jgi:predicted RNA methylase
MSKFNITKNPRPRDYWPTVDSAAISRNFVKWLAEQDVRTFVEPCAGNGSLVKMLENVGLECVGAFDMEPQDSSIYKKEVSELDSHNYTHADIVITNPPFSWTMLKPILEKLLESNLPVCLLLPASFMHNLRSAQFMKYCSHVFSIGRLFWVVDGGQPEMKGIKGKEDFCWYVFDKRNKETTRFYDRRSVR